ncbi:YqaJ viral recombinase family protein [Psychrobacter sp. JB193]|uniref:YqaJ viral recombinase family protein n=1 Tax=Psychrobacter sp. JB193 TaxID=2024406 RepID=UPI000BAB009D|nr:YqaJ viral recombinase family protein [Psychrobacter sp. JB193]PAT63969.1 hypothetical protein CIK80_02330 [Psychrobacter sp. JB193]
MIILDVKQGSPEWLAARLALPTASEMHCLLSDGRVCPPFGQGAFSLADALVAERFTGLSARKFEGNDDTERGHVVEPIAVQEYINSGYATADDVIEAGIMLDKGVGASPDRLIGTDGGLEIKSKHSKGMVTLLRNGKIDKAHITQIQINLWVSGRKWWDYFVYCDGLPPFYQRFEPDLELHAKLDERVPLFLALLDELEQALITGDMPDKFKV